MATNIATIYKGKSERKDIVFSRVWSMPNAWTFTIGPIRELISRYIDKRVRNGWVDPFSGLYSPAEMTNDHNPAMNAKHHLEAIDFCNKLTKKYNGVLFDPPYSFRQISEHYKVIGKKATQRDTSMAFYEKVKSSLCEKVKKGGYVISFGWNSNGFGKARGFKIIEIMIVAHGGSKNDTICTVEQKI